MIYLLLAGFIFLLSYKYDVRCHKKDKLFFYYLVLGILILFAGLRYRVGSDTIVYIGQFKYIPPIDKIFSIGLDKFTQRPLWIIYFSFFKYLGSFYLLQLSTAIIVNCSYFAFAKKNTKNWFTFIFLYFIIYYIGLNFEIMREALASSVAIWGFKYLEQKKWIKYYLISFISFNIHESAMILFILPIFSTINFKIKTWTIILLFLSIAIFLFKSILSDINGLLAVVLGESSFLFSKFDVYSSMDNTYNLNYYLNFWYLPLFCIPLFIIYSKLRLQMNLKNLNLIYISSILSVLMAFMSVLGRFSNYLIVFVLIFLADFLVELVSSKTMKPRIIFFFLLIIFISPSIIIKYQSRYGDGRFYNKYYPYSSIFNEFKDPVRENSADDISGYKIFKY